jgi:DNA-binding XRE family transcriptional regulator
MLFYNDKIYQNEDKMLENDDQKGLKDFGLQIKIKRISLGYSRNSLAKRSRLPLSCIGAIERGDRNPSLLTIAKLGRALGQTEFTVKF